VKATEVIAGLAESNGSLLPSLWRDSHHVTCGLTACTPGSAPGPTLGMGKLYRFYYNIRRTFVPCHRLTLHCVCLVHGVHWSAGWTNICAGTPHCSAESTASGFRPSISGFPTSSSATCTSHSVLSWRRGVVVSGVRRLNEVNARRARLVPGWVTVFGRICHFGM